EGRGVMIVSAAAGGLVVSLHGSCNRFSPILRNPLYLEVRGGVRRRREVMRYLTKAQTVKNGLYWELLTNMP
ncbi:hypothetical protein AAHH78_40335, partial [Burkholderia pseudomallei]